MIDPVSYAFNPQADNAICTIKDIVDDYTAKSSMEIKGTYHTLEKELDWIKEFDERGFAKNFLNIQHFNGTLFIGSTQEPLYETVREVDSLIKREDMPQEYNQDNVVPLQAALG